MGASIFQSSSNIPISIIVPVYNVSDWIDQCIGSIVNQTFADFEVILINDGSTDDSGLKCQKWAERDSRIRLITKENEGPSKARNLGLQESKGTCVVFLDSDDWIDSRYLEILYHRMTETNADLVECDVYRVNSETGVETYRICHGNMGLDYTLEEHMKYGYTAIWKCMFKKELFVRNGIIFPDCHSEARAIYALLLALSSRVENVHSALYYYRILRSGSLSSKPRPRHEDENAIGIEALDILLQGFERCGIYEKYENTLRDIVKLKLSDLLAAFFYRKDKKDFRALTENYHSYLAQKFAGAWDYRYITLGGYNLNRILMHMKPLHDPYCRFNFTGLISLMHPVGVEISCKHKNKYRGMMLQREIKNQFWDILEEIKPKYLFLDFIEERFDVVVCGSGYLTKSDAFDGADCSLEDMEIIERESDECRTLWMHSCEKFIERLQEQHPSTGIVLIKNYLSEKVGDVHSQKMYDYLEEIRRINRILHEYYDFFQSHCEQAIVVEASGCSYYFTDSRYEYGAIPSHLNELTNREIAGMIEESIKE